MKQKNLTIKEIKILKKLLEKLPSIPKIPQELFRLIMSKNVPVTAELAIVRNNKVLLTYRDDAYYKGWHFPGSFISPGETFKETCRRTALKEMNLKIKKSELISTLNTPEGKRFHYLSLIFLCSALGKPLAGKWFSELPSDIIPQHRKLWSIIEVCLKKVK